MTKADIVQSISESTGVDKVTVLNTLEAFMATVKDSLAEGENVYLRRFGTFAIKKRAKKIARNISKNTSVIISAHNVPTLKPSKEFSSKIK